MISWGPGDEALAASLADQLKAPMPPLFDFPDLAAVIARCSLFVAGDTGPLHLADALGIPTVALFGSTEPRRTGPYNLRDGTLSPSSSASGGPRSRKGRRVTSISATTVAASAARILHRGSRVD
jgi:ADP-heptose:LPS heptosyltransferase